MNEHPELAPDLSPAFRAIWHRTREYTMTSIDRMAALHDAVLYLEANKLAGAFVECGVWRGGSAMNMGLTLLHASNNTTRDLYLFDTFAGMSEPTALDVDVHGELAQTTFATMATPDVNRWCYASLEEVTANLRSTGYPQDRLHFVKGKVEETIPAHAPDQIALLRLDTDWFESTQHELQHLFPRLIPGGVLIIDDYGHWQGARRATDAYFEQHKIKPLLFRIDYTGRMMLKARDLNG
jgi:hypothetical protein